MERTLTCHVNFTMTGKELYEIISRRTNIRTELLRIIIEQKEIYPTKGIINRDWRFYEQV